MTISISPLFATEVVDCMAENRWPSAYEVVSVAERIWSDGAPLRSAFAWNDLDIAAPGRLEAMRSARIALCGTPDPAR